MDERRLMTDKECAGILRIILDHLTIPARGSGKTIMQLRYVEALMRAIQVLEEGDNKNDVKNGIIGGLR